MGKITVTYERQSKIPDWATPEVLKTMNKTEGKSLREIAEMTGVSKETIRQLIKKAEKGND